jgi:hypothetical protein
MNGPASDKLQDSWPRFIAHWGAATLGVYLQTFLPQLMTMVDPAVPVAFPRWWAALAVAALISPLASGLNANAPVAPRELVKSLGLGFALNTANVIAGMGSGVA